MSILAILRRYVDYCKSLRPGHLFVYFSMLNLLIYLERSIIPGSNREFVLFIRKHIATEKPDVYIGLLQSGFVAGLSFVSPFVGHMIHKVYPPTLIAFGLFIWCFSVLGSAISGWVGSYTFLLISRMLSGVGEASFICVVPPFICKFGKEYQGRWFAIFYSMLPVGSALGFGYGALLGNSALGWPMAFVFVDIFALMAAITFLFIPANFLIPELSAGQDNEESSLIHSQVDGISPLSSMHDDVAINADNRIEGDTVTFPPLGFMKENQEIEALNKNTQEELLGKAEPSVTRRTDFKGEILVLFFSPIYWLMVVNAAAYSASLQSLNTFGSPFLLFLGYFTNETVASISLGTVVSMTGIAGTLFGGWMLDKLASHSPSEKQLEQCRRSEMLLGIISHSAYSISTLAYQHIQKLARIGTILTVCGVAAMIGFAFAESFYLFLLLACLGLFFIFSTQSAVNLILLFSIPLENRAFAVAASVLLQHLLGDVPATVLMGYLKDILAPDCIFSSDQVILSKKCITESIGIRYTLLIINAWLSWMAISTAVAWMFSRCVTRRRRRSISIT